VQFAKCTFDNEVWWLSIFLCSKLNCWILCDWTRYARMRRVFLVEKRMQHGIQLLSALTKKKVEA